MNERTAVPQKALQNVAYAQKGYTFKLMEPMYVEEARGILRQNGLSYPDAARKMGVSARTIGRYLRPSRTKPIFGPAALVLRYWKMDPGLIPKG